MLILLNFSSFGRLRYESNYPEIKTKEVQILFVEVPKESHKFIFNDFPEDLIKLCSKTIQTWGFIVFHLKNSIPQLSFSKLTSE